MKRIPLIGGPMDGDTKLFKSFDVIPPNLKVACPAEASMSFEPTTMEPEAMGMSKIHDYRLTVYRLPMRNGESHREFMAYVHEECRPPIEMVIRASIRTEFGPAGGER